MSKGVFPLVFIVLLISLAFVSGCVVEVADGCSQDSDCVPSECCHSSTCTNSDLKRSCEDRLCTQECKPGTMDCGQGSCRCIDSKCGAVYT